MKMYMIATINVDNKRVGFRILDSDTGKIMDVPEQSVLQVLKSGQQIINLEISNNTIQGSNGDINRYAKLCNGILQSGKLAPVVVLNQVGENGYTISDHVGKIVKAKMKDVLNYAKNNGIANGKISTRNKTEFISAISGTYEKIEVPPVMISTDYATVIIKPKEEVKDTADKDAKQETTLVLSDEQKSVLKDYYAWAGLNNDTANKEIEYLNKIVNENKLEEAYSCTKLLYEIIAKLGNSYNIAEAFGNETAVRLINFMSAKLPFPLSLIKKCVDYISSDIIHFYTALFSEMTDGVIIILKSNSDTFGVAAKLYLEYMATREILGKYKQFDTETDAYNKQFIKEYLLAKEFTFTELRAVIGAIDLLVNFAAEVNTTFSQNFIKMHENELFYLSNVYYTNMDNNGVTSDDKIALMIALGFNQKYYSKEAAENLRLDTTVIDKTFEQSPHKQYEECLFDSSPAWKKQRGVYIAAEVNIEQLYYKQIQVLEKGQSRIMYAFNEFCIKKFRDRDRAQQEQLREELRIKNEKAELQRKIDREQQIKAEEEKARAEEEAARLRGETSIAEEEKAIASNKSNSIQSDIINNKDISGYDKVELYKNLMQLYKGATTEICFSISNDMISRNLKYSDMTNKQRFRFDEAIEKMLSNIRDKKEDISQPVQSEEVIENKTYFLNEHPEIKEKVDKLISKADTVEMGAVTEKEPFVLKICYSIVKYNKASDKQLKHVNNAIELLNKQ